MKLEHVAIWTNNIERLKEFYAEYFNGVANEKYLNEEKGFESYFLSFESGTRLELMCMNGILNIDRTEGQYWGYCHLAVSVGTMFDVMKLTERLREGGYEVISEPHTTGDGYFESVVLDPDGNRIEITK